MQSEGQKTLETMSGAQWYNNWLFSFIKAYLKRNILEVGGGIGSFSKMLDSYGKVSVIEIDKSYLEKLQKIPNTKVKAGYGDIEKGKYFFKNRKFDTIVCFNVLEHIKNDEMALSNMKRLLARNGFIILLVPAHGLLYSNFDKKIGHFRRYNTSSLMKKIHTAGLEVVDIRYLNWWAAIGWFVFFRLTGWEKMPKAQVGIFDFFGKIFLWPEKYISTPFGLSVLTILK